MDHLVDLNAKDIKANSLKEKRNSVQKEQLPDTNIRYVQDVFIVAAEGWLIDPKLPIPAYIDCEFAELVTTIDAKRGFNKNNPTYFGAAFDLRNLRVAEQTNSMPCDFTLSDSKKIINLQAKAAIKLTPKHLTEYYYKTTRKTLGRGYTLVTLMFTPYLTKGQAGEMKTVVVACKGSVIPLLMAFIQLNKNTSSKALVSSTDVLKATRWLTLPSLSQGGMQHNKRITSGIVKKDRFSGFVNATVCVLAFLLGLVIIMGGWTAQMSPELLNNNPDILKYVAFFVFISSVTVFLFSGIACINLVLAKAMGRK